MCRRLITLWRHPESRAFNRFCYNALCWQWRCRLGRCGLSLFVVFQEPGPRWFEARIESESLRPGLARLLESTLLLQ